MKTFAQYLEGLFDVRTHQHPMTSVAEEFIATLPRQFSHIPKELLKVYVRSVLDGNEQKALSYRTDIMLAAKSYNLVRMLDEMLKQKKQEMAKDISWYADPEHHGKGLGQK